MDEKQIRELREYYDNTDMSAEIADAEWDDQIAPLSMTRINIHTFNDAEAKMFSALDLVQKYPGSR